MRVIRHRGGFLQFGGPGPALAALEQVDRVEVELSTPTERRCPCCHQEIVGMPDPVVTVAELDFGGVTQKTLDYLAAHFSKWVPIYLLIDATYGDRRDGGPLCPDRSIQASMRRVSGRLHRAGLFVDNRSTGGRGSGAYRMRWMAVS